MFFLRLKLFLFLTENLVKVIETFTNREMMVFEDIFTSGQQNSSLEVTVGQASLLGIERRGNRITAEPLSLPTKLSLPSHLNTFTSEFVTYQPFIPCLFVVHDLNSVIVFRCTWAVSVT